MNWLFRLFTDVPSGATVEGMELSVRGLLPLWAAFVLWLHLTAGVVCLYLLEKARLSLPRRIGLVVLRSALIGVLFFLILRPLLVVRYQVDVARDVVFLFDNSQSMTQRDQRLTLAGRLRVAICGSRVLSAWAVSEFVYFDV